MKRLRSLLGFGLIWLAGCGGDTEPRTLFPIWDGKESVEEYARRAKLPAAEKLEVGNGVTIDLVLVPASVGLAGPAEPGVTFQSAKIIAVSSGVMFAALLSALLFWKRPGRRLSFSLRWLLLFTIACGLGMLSYSRWKSAAKQAAEYTAALNEFYAKYEGTAAIPFYMAKTETTVEQYKPSYKGFLAGESARSPAVGVSWSDAAAFCDTLSKRNGKKVKLPSELQWIFACRAGTATEYNTGHLLGENQARFSASGPAEVGSFNPNTFGLYDMHGNVAEWCNDWCEAIKEPEDDEGPTFGRGRITVIRPGQSEHRVVRGGSWRSDSRHCASSNRATADEMARDDVGFRVIVQLDEKD